MLALRYWRSIRFNLPKVNILKAIDMDLAPYTWSGHDKKISDSYLPGLIRMMMLRRIVASAWTFVLHLAPLTTPWIDTRPGLYNIDTTNWTRILQSLRPRNSQIRTRGFGALKYWRTLEARLFMYWLLLGPISLWTMEISFVFIFLICFFSILNVKE